MSTRKKNSLVDKPKHTPLDPPSQLALLQAALQQISQPVILFDPKGHFIFANPQADALVRSLPQQIPDLYERIWSQIAHISQASTGSIPVETRLDLSDTSKPLALSASPLYAPGGSLVAIQATLSIEENDFPAPQTNRSDFENNEQKLKKILEGIQDAFFAVDRNLRFTYMNQKAAALTGRTAEDLVGKTLLELWPRYRGTALEEIFREAIEQGSSIQRKFAGIYTNRHYEASIYSSEEGYSAFVVDKTESVLQEQALQASQERLSDFLESTHDVFFALDHDWRIIYINRQFTHYFHRSPEQVLGQNFWETFPGYRDTAVEEAYHQAMDKRVPVHFEIGGIYTQEWFELSIYPTRDGISIFGANRTQRHQAERLLAESEARFRTLADNISQLAWMADESGSIFWYNQRWFDYTGTTPEEMQGWGWTKVQHPEYVDRVVEKIRHSFSTGEVWEDVFPMRSKAGDYRWFLSRGMPILDEHGKVIRWFGTSTDITEQKQTEQALQERNDRLAMLSDAARDLLVSEQPAEYLEKFYHRLAQLLHLDVYLHYELSADGTHLEKVSMSGFSEEVQEDVKRVDLGEAVSGTVAVSMQPWVLENLQQSTDEETSFLRSVGLQGYASFPMVVKDRLIGTLSFGSYQRSRFSPQSVGLMRAISDLVAVAIARKHSETDLQAYSNRLEQSNQDLEEFAYVASHDLQEPLRKISNFGRMLYQGLADRLSGEQQDQFERMLNAAQRLQAMIQDLLDLSRVTTQGQPFQPVDLREVVEEVVSYLEVSLTKTGGRVEIEDLPTVDADRGQMSRLFLNLISNSLKYHREGVPPVVRVSSSQTQMKGQEHHQIWVEDNGIGFEMQYVDRIFHPFQRLHGRNEYEGTGIGLAIVKRIVERHGWKITAESEPGGGSKFLIQYTRNIISH